MSVKDELSYPNASQCLIIIHVCQSVPN